MTKAGVINSNKTDSPMHNGELLARELRMKILKAKITEAIKMQHWYDDVISGNIIRER